MAFLGVRDLLKLIIGSSWLEHGQKIVNHKGSPDAQLRQPGSFSIGDDSLQKWYQCVRLSEYYNLDY